MFHNGALNCFYKLCSCCSQNWPTGLSVHTTCLRNTQHVAFEDSLNICSQILESYKGYSLGYNPPKFPCCSQQQPHPGTNSHLLFMWQIQLEINNPIVFHWYSHITEGLGAAGRMWVIYQGPIQSQQALQGSERCWWQAFPLTITTTGERRPCKAENFVLQHLILQIKFFFSFLIPSRLSYSHYSKKNLSLLQETLHSLTKKCLYLTQTATHSENQHLGSLKLNHSSPQDFLELLLKQHFNEKMHMFSSRKKNCLRSCGNFSSRSRLSYS